MCINYPTLCAMTKTSLPFFLSCLLFFHKGYLMSSTAARLIDLPSVLWQGYEQTHEFKNVSPVNIPITGL